MYSAVLSGRGSPKTQLHTMGHWSTRWHSVDAVWTVIEPVSTIIATSVEGGYLHYITCSPEHYLLWNINKNQILQFTISSALCSFLWDFIILYYTACTIILLHKNIEILERENKKDRETKKREKRRQRNEDRNWDRETKTGIWIQ